MMDSQRYCRNGIQVFYDYRGGEEPGLVFIHGFGCSIETWQHQLDYFAGKFSVLACDLPGHGSSKGLSRHFNIEACAVQIIALLDEIGFSEIILVGHSMGCRVALEINKKVEKRVQGIVLLDGSYTAPIEEVNTKGNFLFLTEHSEYENIIRHLAEGMFIGDEIDVEFKQQVVEKMLMLPEEVGRSMLTDIALWDKKHMIDALDSVEAPLLAIQSTDSGDNFQRVTLETDQASRWLGLLKKWIVDPEIEVVPGKSHFNMIENYLIINDLLEGFIMRCRSR